MVQIRRATRDDVDAAADTLAAAFSGYPFIRHVVAADDHERRVRELQRLFLVEVGLAHGAVWVADDCAAVAVWTTPDTDAAAAFGPLAERAAHLAGDRAEVSARAERAFGPHRPTGPAWFLGTVGVRPDRQGRGLGSAVIRPGLAAADEAGAPAYLETTGDRNVRLYRRLGFEVTAEVQLPDGGPLTWCMSRPPRAT
ncbi:GNAT family N-acetyltransferase [Saccharothrix algeriensis]|nr:GNAT family N-acetyltransferase [Saccharothrix algeriensis]MBM7815003.1 ribosomal protein S18 acetylase RimI-like enzyme [Saccharothrix algeriensis]